MAEKRTKERQLERIVNEVVDLRTNFGKNISEISGKLTGSREVALKELFTKIKEKGIKNLSQPVKFKLVGFEKGGKFERIAESISGQRLRVVYKYSISYGETRAGYREGIGQLGVLGEIEIGRKLKKWLPELSGILGDKRYKEFFKPSGLKKRADELNATTRKRVEDAVMEELSKTGYDVSELQEYLKDFFITKALQERGSDIYWLKRQVSAGKIADENLERALISLMEEPDYSKEDAILAGEAIMELRKKPTKGFIGSLAEDLMFLDSDEERRKEVYNADLDQLFIRKQFYPERRQIEEGKIREKLRQDTMSFAEALGIVRAFPGIAEARKNLNRKNALRYFFNMQNTQDVNAYTQQAVANLNNAINILIPSFEKDREEWHEAKKSRRKADLYLKNNYGFFKEIDWIRLLDKEKGNWANLIRWIKMKDSKRIFSGLYTLSQQVKFIKEYENKISGRGMYISEGVMAVAYENSIDFEEMTGIDLKDAVKKIEIIDMEKPTAEDRQRAKKAKTGLTTYRKFRKENLERLVKGAEFNLVQAKSIKDIVKFYPLVKEYTKATGDLKGKIDFMLAIERCCGLRTSSYYLPINNLFRIYTSPEEKSMAESVYSKIIKHERFKRLAEMTNQERGKTLGELEEKRQKIKEQKQAAIYHGDEKMLNPAWNFIKRFPTFLAKGISLIEPEKIIETEEKLEGAIAGEQLGAEFLKKLKAIEKNILGNDILEADSKIKASKKNMGYFIFDFERDAGNMLVSKNLVSQIERIYEAVKNYETQKIYKLSRRLHEGVIEKESLWKLTKGRLYDISAYSEDIRNPKGILIEAFSKKHGGIGFLRWDQDKGWYAEKIRKERLTDLMETLKSRKTNVKLRIDKVYE